MSRSYEQRAQHTDLHHPFFPKIYHRKGYKEAARIANKIVVKDMWRPIHEELHRNVSGVPPLGYYALLRVNRELLPRYDGPIEAIDHYSGIVERAAKNPKCKVGEAALNLLHVETLREQIPFIQDNEAHKKRRTIV